MNGCVHCAQGNPVRRSPDGVWMHNLGNGERRGCPIISDYSRFTNLAEANTELRTALLKIATETEDPNAEAIAKRALGMPVAVGAKPGGQG